MDCLECKYGKFLHDLLLTSFSMTRRTFTALRSPRHQHLSLTLWGMPQIYFITPPSTLAETAAHPRLSSSPLPPSPLMLSMGPCLGATRTVVRSTQLMRMERFPNSSKITPTSQPLVSMEWPSTAKIHSSTQLMTLQTRSGLIK